MKRIYKECSLEKCLQDVVDEFKVPLEEIKYEILQEKKSIFRKKVVIQVDIPEEYTKKEVNKNIKETDNNKENKLSNINEKDGTIKIVQGKIIVTNAKEEGNPACIIVGNNVKVLIDGTVIRGKVKVFEENSIEVLFEETIAKRNFNISLSEDNMKVYGEIIYEPKYCYKLKDKEENVSVVLEAETESETYPPKYNIEEIKQELGKNNVVYGIIEENLKKCMEDSCKKILIAKGQDTVDGEDDRIEIKFETDDDYRKLKEDKQGNVDFKSIGAIEAVNKGDIIAIKHLGKDGQDGRDVTGKVKKHKIGEKLRLKAGRGAILKDESTIIAALDGKPCVKNNVFYVYQIHEIKKDVDLTTGNIKFEGDITVLGSVREGMEIDCGNFLTIEKDTERCKIRAKGNILIKGNSIASSIFAGGEDVEKLTLLKQLQQLEENLNNLVQAVEEIKKFNLLGEDKKDGEIIKILIENKFKQIPRMCFSIVMDLNKKDNDTYEKDLVALIRGKLLGLAPISIKHYSELILILNLIKEITNISKENLHIPVNVKISYVQDSKIESSGDIIITGKGEYISDITANGNIYFVQKNSLSRGGRLKAKDEIRCRTVGSKAGVSTKLHVEKQGHIWVDAAYQNTMFSIGNRDFILDIPSKNIHAYLDDKGDMVLDKLKL